MQWRWRVVRLAVEVLSGTGGWCGGGAGKGTDSGRQSMRTESSESHCVLRAKYIHGAMRLEVEYSEVLEMSYASYYNFHPSGALTCPTQVVALPLWLLCLSLALPNGPRRGEQINARPLANQHPRHALRRTARAWASGMLSLCPQQAATSAQSWNSQTRSCSRHIRCTRCGA